MKTRFLNWLKSKTEKGMLFRLRSRALLALVYLCNLDQLLLRKSRPTMAKPAGGKPRVGVLSMYRPLFWHGNIFEMQMNKKLQGEDCTVVHILCRGALDVCDALFSQSNKKTNPSICRDCTARNKLFYAKNGAEVLWIDDFVSKDELREEYAKIAALDSIEAARGYVFQAKPFGNWVRLSVCRYFLRLGLNAEHLPVYKEFLRAAVLLQVGYERILEKYHFDRFLIFNGRYSTFQIPLRLFESRQIPYATYELSEQERFFFANNAIAVMWDDVDAKFNAWLGSGVAVEGLGAQVDEFIDQRRKRFVSSYVSLDSTLEFQEPAELAIFSNVVWDSAAFERDILFRDQFHWMEELVRWAAARPALKTVVRIHPAETNTIYNKSDERMLEFIRGKFPVLPPNIHVIPPEERKNSYGLVRQSKVVAAYSSSIGLESALEGKPVFLGGWTHFHRPGISWQGASAQEYFSLLEKALQSPQAFAPDAELVRKYVYWYYKVYHRLVNTDLYDKPFVYYEDSRFLRVPQVHESFSPEMAALTQEFLGAQPPMERHPGLS